MTSINLSRSSPAILLLNHTRCSLALAGWPLGWSWLTACSHIFNSESHLWTSTSLEPFHTVPATKFGIFVHQSMMFMVYFFVGGGRSDLMLQIDCGFHQFNCLHDFQSPIYIFCKYIKWLYITSLSVSLSVAFLMTSDHFVLLECV